MDIKNLVLTKEGKKVLEEGAWVDSHMSGVSFKVIGTTSSIGKKALQSKLFNARARGVELSLERARIEVLAETLLLDWKGLTNDGEPVEFDREKAVNWILSEEGDRLADLVLACAFKLDENTNDYIEQVTKN